MDTLPNLRSNKLCSLILLIICSFSCSSLSEIEEIRNLSIVEYHLNSVEVNLSDNQTKQKEITIMGNVIFDNCGELIGYKKSYDNKWPEKKEYYKKVIMASSSPQKSIYLEQLEAGLNISNEDIQITQITIELVVKKIAANCIKKDKDFLITLKEGGPLPEPFFYIIKIKDNHLPVFWIGATK